MLHLRAALTLLHSHITRDVASISSAFSHLARRALSTRTPSHPQPAPNPAVFLRRQSQTVAIPATYSGLNAGPAPGTVVGIVLGSVAGFLFLLWLIYLATGAARGGGVVVEEEVIRPRRRRSRSPRSTRRSRSRSEVIEVRSRSPPRPRTERVIIEETIRSSAPPPREVERDDDIVEVIEEHSPPPRRRSSNRQSGYRTVDPDAYGGGSRPLRKVSRR